jgi:hypothetical protein
MHKLMLCLAALLACASAQASDDRPTGTNCDLAAPPAAAGEEIAHGMLLKVHPRARDIGAGYSGCQGMWMPQRDGWTVVTLTYIENGAAVRYWTPAARDPDHKACRYAQGKLVDGREDTCRAPEALIFKSLAPGCAERSRQAGRLLEDCVYE